LSQQLPRHSPFFVKARSRMSPFIGQA
jgi:hypothetical protein